MDRVTEFWRRKPLASVSAVIAVLVIGRVIALLVSPLELGPDEAQYWRWSQVFDWGYYSKPPLISWIIGASTATFGNVEWAVRLASPIAHGIAALALFGLARRMFDETIGAWTAALYLLMPGVWLSSMLMSTDAILLPLWSLGLYFLWRLRETPSFAMALGLGLSFGFAMLAKYAALYFLLGAGLAAIVDAPTRRALLSLSGATAGLVALAVLTPNLLWNAANDFATVSHTGDNANWNHAQFDPMNLGKFIIDQMGVFGPIAFILVLVSAFFLLRRPPAETTNEPGTRRKWLLCFVLPPLIMIAVQAVIARAHANWAATAYPAASVYLAAFAARNVTWRNWVGAGVALNALIGVVFLVFALSPGLADAARVDNAFKRARGWEAMTTELSEIADVVGASAILFDEREPWHGADFYGRNMDLPPLRAWRKMEDGQNFAEQEAALQAGEDSAVLIASMVPSLRERVAADFESVEPIGEVVIPLGANRSRKLAIFIGRGFDPLPRTPEYFEKYDPET